MPKVSKNIIRPQETWKQIGRKVDPKINLDEYEIIPQSANIASKIITDMWIRLGRPKDPFSESGAKLLDLIIAIWQDMEPYESYKWFEDRKEYKNNEMSITSQVHNKTGRSLASYPYMVFQLMKAVFPDIKLADRQTVIKLVTKWPMFQMANRV